VISLFKAIRAINPSAECTVPENVDNIIWHNDTSPISKEDILAKQTELQAEYDSLAYARSRKQAYPNVDEFMEAYTEKEIGGDSTKWDAYVINYNKVRTDNPKE
jgi:hypothetical protein